MRVVIRVEKTFEFDSDQLDEATLQEALEETGAEDATDPTVEEVKRAIENILENDPEALIGSLDENISLDDMTVEIKREGE